MWVCWGILHSSTHPTFLHTSTFLYIWREVSGSAPGRSVIWFNSVCRVWLKLSNLYMFPDVMEPLWPYRRRAILNFTRLVFGLLCAASTDNEIPCTSWFATNVQYVSLVFNVGCSHVIWSYYIWAHWEQWKFFHVISETISVFTSDFYLQSHVQVIAVMKILFPSQISVALPATVQHTTSQQPQHTTWWFQDASVTTYMTQQCPGFDPPSLQAHVIPFKNFSNKASASLTTLFVLLLSQHLETWKNAGQILKI